MRWSIMTCVQGGMRGWPLTAAFALAFVTGFSAQVKSAPSGLPAATMSAEERRLVDLIRSELSRHQKAYRKKQKKADRPYFIEAQLFVTNARQINGSYGTLYDDFTKRSALLVIDCRIGDYSSDNSSFDRRSPYLAQGYVSLDAEPESLRRDIWQLMDQAYKDALEMVFQRKRSEVKSARDEKKTPSFTKEKPVTYYEAPKPIRFVAEKWIEQLLGLSGGFRKFPDIYDDKFFLNFTFTKRYLINTEGFEVVTRDELFSLVMTGQVRASDGAMLDDYRAFYSNRSDRLPDFARIGADRDRLIKDVLALKSAPAEEPRTAPAIFSPEAAAVLFHEAIGHRLEGERQESEDSGQTFRSRLNERIVSEIISIEDDPRLTEFDGTPLIGSYTHDSQGIAAQRVSLVENGILRNFLLSRQPVLDFTKSNGHGRAQPGFRPVARMGVLRIRARDGVSPEELERRLIEEAKRQKKPYAYYVERVEGGETNTGRVGAQAVLGRLKVVYRINVETGKKEMIRGVEIVGTPLTLVNNILKAGTDYRVLNGFCGAESGMVPVSHIAPSVLLSEVEFQKQQIQKTRAPIADRP